MHDRDKIYNNIITTMIRVHVHVINIGAHVIDRMITSSLLGGEVANEMQHYRNSGHQNLTAGSLRPNLTLLSELKCPSTIFF